MSERPILPPKSTQSGGCGDAEGELWCMWRVTREPAIQRRARCLLGAGVKGDWLGSGLRRGDLYVRQGSNT